LVLPQFQDRFAGPYLGEKGFGVEPIIRELPTGASFAPMNERASHYSSSNAKMKQLRTSRGKLADGLKSPTPTAAPPASPSAATTSKESHDEEQQYRTDGSVDDGADHSGTEMDTQLRQQPASDKGAQNPDNEVSNDPESGALHNLTCQPACNETDKQYDQ
jgi:hypothetical protein